MLLDGLFVPGSGFFGRSSCVVITEWNLLEMLDFDKIRVRLLSLGRNRKQQLLVATDTILILGLLWLSFSIYFHLIFIPNTFDLIVFLSAPLVLIPVYMRLGLYKAILQYLPSQAVLTILLGTTVSLVLWAIVVKYMIGYRLSLLVVMNLWLGVVTMMTATRFLVKYALYGKGAGKEGKNLFIYGSGDSGIQLFGALMEGRGKYNILGFIDDKVSRQNLQIHGYPIYSFEKSVDLLEQGLVDEVILAMPSASHARHRDIIENLEPYPVMVKTLPSLSELVEGKISVSDIKEISIDDLLGREPVPPNEVMLNANIKGKVVLVTGAGGSIGSELCRQVVRCQPDELILFEQNEFCLYRIEQALEAEIQRHSPGRIRISKYLGSINDAQLLKRVFCRKIHTIYHAAAYKHVPLVEMNPVAGLKNNTFGTKMLAEMSADAGVDTFVLISTDKAVRPTNIMGCSKRLAEMALQALADHLKSDNRSQTTFTMVRFGNVLGSSGSVVPKFRQQIRDGGPITLTHEKIIRYFMSIPEAAQLVIQAGAMAKGGDVFVLEMGQPVKIMDLAVKMIHLAGLSVINESNPDGDISIEITGLRPGEKLFEELLIDENVLETDHPMIMRANESYLSWENLTGAFEELDALMENEDRDGIKSLLERVVKGYSSWKQDAESSGETIGEIDVPGQKPSRSGSVQSAV